MRMDSSKALAAVWWRTSLVADVLRGPAARRHRAFATLRGLLRRHLWRKRVRRFRRASPPRSVIAIAMVEHLGDIVATEPVARHVRVTWPDAHVVWVVRVAYRELIDSNPNVDETLTVGCLTEWMHLSGGRVFDRMIDLQIPGRFCPTCNCRLVNPTAGGRIGMHDYYHHGNLLAIACQCAGLPVLDDAPAVYIPQAAVDAVHALHLPERFIVVHCTSNQDVRDWDTEKWRQLAAHLSQRHRIPVVEVGLAPLIASADERYVNLCGRLSILQTAEVIRRAILFIGVDSGPAHLANACRTAGVILLGHYRSYARYMPYSGDYANGANATILYADGPASALPVEHVIEAVESRLSSLSSPTLATASSTPDQRRGECA
jgi:ADP-heptose:LPS heptosyltransferase